MDKEDCLALAITCFMKRLKMKKVIITTEEMEKLRKNPIGLHVKIKSGENKKMIFEIDTQ